MADKPKHKRYFAPSGGVSKTIQNHREGITVPEIVNRYRLTGTLPQSRMVPQFFDVSVVPSLLEALNVGAKFNTYFSMLPSSVRDEFHNDPKRLMRALTDPAQQKRLVELGIAKGPDPITHQLGSKENPIHTAVPEIPKDLSSGQIGSKPV